MVWQSQTITKNVNYLPSLFIKIRQVVRLITITARPAINQLILFNRYPALVFRYCARFQNLKEWTRSSHLSWSDWCVCVCCQDAHEFLSQCLDQLKDDVEKINKSWTSDSASSSSSSSAVCENGVSASSKTEPGDEADTSRVYTCPVAVNMEFEVQHTITCKW